MKTDLLEWIQEDYNPFILFSKDGKVVYLNNEAEYLLGFVSYKELFDFTIANAKNQKGIFLSFGRYIFDKFEFAGVSIGYLNNEEIGVKLYKTLSFPKEREKVKKFELINLFFIVDFCRNYIFLDKDIEFIDDFDIDIPQFWSEKKELIDVLNAIFSSFTDKKLKTIIRFEIGETMVVDNHKYGVISVTIVGKREEKEVCSDFFTIIQNRNFAKILIPFIKNL